MKLKNLILPSQKITPLKEDIEGFLVGGFATNPRTELEINSEFPLNINTNTNTIESCSCFCKRRNPKCTNNCINLEVCTTEDTTEDTTDDSTDDTINGIFGLRNNMFSSCLF